MTWTFDDEMVGKWVSEGTKGQWVKGRGTAIGQIQNDALSAGVLYEDYNHANVVCHIRAVGNWANKHFLWMIFDYPFNQLKVKRITCPINDNNAKSIRLVEKMGFIMEARLSQATPDGDLLLYSMFRENCKYIKGRYGKT